MPKFVLSMLLLSFANSAFAGGEFSSGAFVSGGLGWGFGDSGKPKESFKDFDATFSPSADFKGKIKLSGITGEAALGYHYFRQSFGLGADVFFELSSLKGKKEGTTSVSSSYGKATLPFQLSLRKNRGFGLRFRPGILLGESKRTFLHATIGVAFSHFKATSFNKDESTAASASFFRVAKKKTLSGLIIGGGVVTKITPCVSAGVEYLYTKYGKMNHSFAFDPTDHPREGTTTLKLNPSVMQVMFKVAYHFGGKKVAAS